jgi:hypothetical protein
MSRNTGTLVGIAVGVAITLGVVLAMQFASSTTGDGADDSTETGPPTAEEVVAHVTSDAFAALPDKKKEAYIDRAVEHLDEAQLFEALGREWRRRRATTEPASARTTEPGAAGGRPGRGRGTVGLLVRKVLDKRMDEFFAASEEQRQAMLDEQIDRMLALREQREARRRKTPPRPESTSNRSEASRRPRRRFTLARVKQHIEHSTPEERARREAYFRALRERMKARGIEFRRGRRR